MTAAEPTGPAPDQAAEDFRLLAIVRSQPRDSPEHEAACQALVGHYQWLVTSCVRRYRSSPETAEDLTQVGYLGLMKAINGFDPGHGNDLAAYARPTISGEIKRHFRDKRWQVHVTRPVQELRLDMHAATAELTQQLQRTPADSEIAKFLHVSDESLAEARNADLTFQARSLDAPPPGGDEPGSRELHDLIGGPDPQLEQVIDTQALETHWPELPPVQQRVLMLRFFGNLTQADIGAQLGVSQMQISRLQSRALKYLRAAIQGEPPDGAAPA